MASQKPIPRDSAGSSPKAALLMTPDELVSRLYTQREKVVLIEVISPEEASAAPRRIPSAQRVWRPEIEEPVTASQPLSGMAPTALAFSEFAQGLGINDDSGRTATSNKVIMNRKLRV